MELSLPYPDMEFTPLDILSADDMNKILANQQYLANFDGDLGEFVGKVQANTLNADGTLKDSVVKARNIDQDLFKQIYAAGRATAVTLSNQNGGNFIPFIYSDGAEYMSGVTDGSSPHNVFTVPEDGYYLASAFIELKAVTGTCGYLEVNSGGGYEGSHKNYTIENNKRMLDSLITFMKKTKGQQIQFYLWCWGTSGKEVLANANIQILKVA